MTFNVTIDDSNDLLVEDYLSQVDEDLSKTAEESTVEMIVDIYYLSVKSMEAMEECKKNPGDVWSHAEMMRYYGLA
ncbi:MAG: hypothetical protein IJS69_06785 [Selenomonadaceae bacterium]|nr:hypothetical protein [Selenomonadaceae bacterium]